MKLVFAALLSGTVFGAGLAVAEMTNPAKVLGFLDLAGSWDPSLAFVMGTALAASAVAYRLHRSPAPAAGSIDSRLIGGACLFGMGWGIAGFCPGPAVASLVTGSADVALFVGAMLGGMGLFHLVEKTAPRKVAQHAA